MSLIQVTQLQKHFLVQQKVIRAVDDLSFTIERGEILGLVGESGSGKSTLGKLLLRFLSPTSGAIYFEDEPLTSIPQKALAKKMQMIFQDPFSSLNPRMTVGQILEEPFHIHQLPPQTLDLLNLVALPRNASNRYPHEFSGGQRQRIGIARALALHPDFLVCDEPISALDVSVQAQIINLLLDLQEKLRLTYLFISHDLAIVRHISSRIAVMYMGQIVEIAKTEMLYQEPLHPYTQLLLSSLPTLKKRLIFPKREMHIRDTQHIGCPFYARCPFSMPICRSKLPLLQEVEKSRFVACHLYSERVPTPSRQCENL